MLRIVSSTSNYCFDVHNSLRLDVELCSLQFAHFLDRANIDNRCFPSNRLDKTAHVSAQKIHSGAADQYTSQKQTISSENIHCWFGETNRARRGNSSAGQGSRRVNKALFGKHACANSFTECERGTNATDDRGFSCQSGTFSQPIHGLDTSAMGTE